MWATFDTAPQDGTFFICYNGKEMAILNQPPGCALGRWHKHKGKWYGASVQFDNPTHWMPLPKKPT